jgi:hypothetical protein
MNALTRHWGNSGVIWYKKAFNLALQPLLKAGKILTLFLVNYK